MSEHTEDRLRGSILEWATDRFVGLHTAPWTAIHPNDGAATGGDRVQLTIRGEPGQWSIFRTRKYENRRDELDDGELLARDTQALVTGELCERPTVPIKHLEWPDDYDLELNLGTRFKTVTNDEGHERDILVASGVKNYELQACDDAVFFTPDTIDWLSPAEDDAPAPATTGHHTDGQPWGVTEGGG